MLNTAEAFNALMQQVLAGSEAAAEELFRDYEPYLLHAIRQRLSKRLRSNFDSLDIAQDVWKSFFVAPPAERHFQSPAELVAFLTKLAAHKVIDAARKRLRGQKHEAGREQSIDDSQSFDKNRLAAPDRTPSQILMSQEEWVKFLGEQPLVYRQVFILLREGKTHEEIAAELKISTKSVQRALGQLVTRISHEP